MRVGDWKYIQSINHYVWPMPVNGKLGKLSKPTTGPLPNAQAMESAQGFIARVTKMDVGLCPCCRLARLHVGAVLAGQARLPEPIGVVTQHSRGPPS